MKRKLQASIEESLREKIILLSGPRQCGKTTLAKMLSENPEYINFDLAEHRIILQEKSWDRSKPLLILDELHKMKNWKSWLKGVYDTEGLKPPIIVTGSARLNTYRKVGDSMAGRYFPFCLHPFDLKEISNNSPAQSYEDILDRLLTVGGFPEPYLKGTLPYYNRWKKTHLDIILRQDLIETESIREIIQIETLIELLRSRVGSPVSYSSLSRDLECSDKTVKKWLTLLENMYVIFKLTPYHRNIGRALQKAPKYYFYDTAQVKGDLGIRLENQIACSLLKEIHFRMDCLGEEWDLYYLRTKDGSEVDFCVTHNDKPELLIEAKWKDNQPSKSMAQFAKILNITRGIQLCKECTKEKTFPSGLEIRHASSWLAKMPLNQTEVSA